MRQFKVMFLTYLWLMFSLYDDFHKTYTQHFLETLTFQQGRININRIVLILSNMYSTGAVQDMNSIGLASVLVCQLQFLSLR